MLIEIMQRGHMLLLCRHIMLNIVIYGCILQGLSAAPITEDPLQMIGAKIMKFFDQAAELIQNGGAMRHERGFEMPFFSANSKTEIGIGEAINERGNYEDDSAEERRRRKREITTDQAQNNDVFSSLLRSKRSPCSGIGAMPPSSGGSDGNIDDAETVRRRSARLQARKRSATTKAKKTSNSAKTRSKPKTKSGRRRRRRQTELDELDSSTQDDESKFSDHVRQFAEKMQGIFQSILSTMSQLMQHIAQSFQSDETIDAEKI